MSRAKWLLVGVATLGLLGCATGSAEDQGDGAGEDAAGPVTDGASSNADANGIEPGGDAAEDSTLPNGGDANPPGDDAESTDDAPGAADGSMDDATDHDASEPDAETSDAGGHDAETDATGPDTGAPTDAGTGAHDAAAPDAGGAKDSGGADASDASSGAVDAGVDGCSPGAVGTTDTGHSPPVDTHQCTTTQAQQFYDACLGGPDAGVSCSTWQNELANTVCYSCLAGASSPTGTDWGPFVYWPTDGVIEINTGGCLLAEDFSTQANTCGDDYEYLQECEHAACDQACSTSSFADYQACATAADTGVCSAYNTPITSGSGPCAGFQVQNSLCYQQPSFEQAFLNIAQVMCE